MKKQEKISYEIVLSEEEAQIFKRSLVYIIHRIREHGKDGGVCSYERAISLRDELNRF